MNRKLCGPKGRSGRKEEKIHWPLTGNEPQFLGRPDRSLSNTPTVLFRLMHGGENRVGLIIQQTEIHTITWEVRKLITVYHSYVLWYLWQSITTTFDGIWDSLSQLRLMISVTVYHSYVWWYLGQSITATFDGICDSLSQLRLMVSVTVYHSYVWW